MSIIDEMTKEIFSVKEAVSASAASYIGYSDDIAEMRTQINQLSDMLGSLSQTVFDSGMMSEEQLSDMLGSRFMIHREIWASGDELSDDEHQKVLYLRNRGCRCKLPLLGEVMKDGSWKPRCRSCGTNSRQK